MPCTNYRGIDQLASGDAEQCKVTIMKLHLFHSGAHYKDIEQGFSFRTLLSYNCLLPVFSAPISYQSARNTPSMQTELYPTSTEAGLGISCRDPLLPSFIANSCSNAALRASNVASVPHYSPFRYPGGKTWLANVIRQWLQTSKAAVLYEPFAGGGSMSLLAVIERYVPRAVLFEKDAAVASVWKTILSSDCQWLIDRILQFRLSPESVNEVLGGNTRKTRTLAFQTILKNRCRRGGILAGGAGLLIRGERDNGIKSRWYPETLAKRIQLIHQHKDQFEFNEGDVISHLPKLLKTRSAKFFVDPPYPKLMSPGVKPLYSHFRMDHRKLCQMLAKSDADYLLTYDDTNYVRTLLADCELQYCAVDMRNSNGTPKRELLISNDVPAFSR